MESAAPQKPKNTVLSVTRIAVHAAALTGPTYPTSSSSAIGTSVMPCGINTETASSGERSMHSAMLNAVHPHRFERRSKDIFLFSNVNPFFFNIAGEHDPQKMSSFQFIIPHSANFV